MRRKLTLITSICLMIILAMLTLSLSCTKETTPATTAPATTAPATTAPVEATKVYELTINDHNPEGGFPGMASEVWARKVEEASGGRLILNVYYGGSLLKGNEALRGIQTGVCDGGLLGGLTSEQGAVLNNVMLLPFMGWPAQPDTSEIYRSLLNKYPQLIAEFGESMEIIVLVEMPPDHIHFVKKAVKYPEDLKGIKISCQGARAEVLAMLGGTPVTVDLADLYMSLDRGLVEGVWDHVAVLGTFGTLELMPYHAVFGDGGIQQNPMMFIFNTNSIAKLPADLQQILRDSEDFYREAFWEGDLGNQAKQWANIAAWGHTRIDLTPEDIEVWRTAAMPYHDKWLETCKEAGLPGEEIYADALALIKQYQK